ncbi:MAG: hypothetical protein KA167_01165, partial [Ottowia sp.]|nr:hypothetical protein [Ottowia sp.]
MADTRVQLIMSVVDRALGPLKRIADGAGGLAGRAKAASDAVKGLNSQVKSIDKFAKVSRDLAVTNNALQTARERTKSLAAELRATEQPTDAMRAAFAAARSEAARLKDRQAALT